MNEESMFDPFYLLLWFVPISFLIGVLVLLIRIIKKQLLRSNKYTSRTKSLLNISLIALLLLFAVWWNNTLNSRTPAKEIIEEVSHIQLPENIIVLKDEYHDYFPDYSIECIIQFDRKAAKEYTRAIRKSAAFDRKRLESKELSHLIPSNKGIWCRTDHGYRFGLFNGQQGENIYFDTLTRKLYYEGGSF